MKANEFVEKFGWIAVKHDFSVYFKDEKIGTIQILTHEGEYIEVNGEDLKRLVESHELVAIHGFEKSKEIVANAPSDDHFYSWTLGDSGVRDKTVNIGKLRKAIADVESCMDVSSESN